MGTVESHTDLVGAHVLLAGLLLHGCCLAQGPDRRAHFGGCEPVSWVLLADCGLDTRVVVTLTRAQGGSRLLCKSEGRCGSLTVEVK